MWRTAHTADSRKPSSARRNPPRPRLPTTSASAPSASWRSTSAGLPCIRRRRTRAAPDSPRSWCSWLIRPCSAIVLSKTGSTAGADQRCAPGSSQAVTATTSPPIRSACRTAQRSVACDGDEPSTPTTTREAEFRSGARSAVIPGDCVHHPVQLHRSATTSCVDIDPGQAVRSRRELIASLADTETLLLGGHFPPPRSRVSSPPRQALSGRSPFLGFRPDPSRARRCARPIPARSPIA